MTIHSTQRQLDGPFKTSVPVEKLAEFYRANGYELLEVVDPDSDEDSDANEPDRVAQFERGETEARWWSSDMSRLPTRVEVRRENDGLTIEYEVDVTGQHLTDADRDFWEREIQAAGNFLRNPSRRPRDLRHEEAKRAEQLRRRFLSYGIWAAIIAFLMVVLIKLMTTV